MTVERRTERDRPPLVRRVEPTAGRRHAGAEGAGAEVEHGLGTMQTSGETAATRSPGSPSVDSLVRLQRLAGNAALAGLFAARRAATVQRQPVGGGVAAGAGPAPHPVLRGGDTGEAVRELQEKLSLATAAGGPLVTDGDFGPATRRRLVAFRRAGALGRSPVADAALWVALDAAVAALPAPVRLTLSLGDTGPDVGLAQQKLNAIAGAGASLPIDGVFSARMLALVLAFQVGRRILPTGTINAATWTALDRAARGGGTRLEGGAPVEQHVRNTAGASPLGRPIAGSSLHAAVGPGGIRRGPAVREFQLKLNAWRSGQALPAIADDGRWGTETRTATLAFQAATPALSPPSGVGDVATWTALDAVAPAVAVGFQERQWREEVGGHTYGMTNAGAGGSRYSWEILGREILVTTKIRFTGAPAPAAWFGHVPRAWNRYRAVRDGTGESLLISFRIARGSGPDSRTVNVVAPPTTGRANAGTWYVADTAADETIPHEFGHLIGLRDEYQLHPGDFREITGREPDVGATAGPAGVTPLTIAQNLRAAMMARNVANAAAAVAGVQPGAFAQQIVAQYATLGAATVPAVAAAPGTPAQAAVPLTTNLVRDLDKALPEDAAGQRYATIQVLTYTSGSLMGDPGRVTDSHDHGVQPRHVEEFVDILQRVRGGRWRAVLR